MSKRCLIAICVLLFVGMGVFIGICVSRNAMNGKIGEQEIYQDDESVTTTSKEEEVILPTAKLIMKQHYKKCGHTTLNEFSVPEDIVNMTKEQVEKYYFGWEIEKFSGKELVIYRAFPGLCEEHYIVKEVDGHVDVYSKDDSGKENFVYATDVNTKYLPKEDKEKLLNGIEIIGKENLYTLLEDYE